MTEETTICAQCDTPLVPGQDQERTDDGVFCRPCFDELSRQIRRAVAAQGENVPYASAIAGGLAGGAIGVVAWWGFTVLTNVAFGLVAVIIGYLVGQGVVRLSGGKRSRGLQIVSVSLATAAFFYASYLVNRTFLIRALAEEVSAETLPWLPGPGMLFGVVRLGFGLMDVVFLAIVVYQAWKIPAPFRLRS